MANDKTKINVTIPLKPFRILLRSFYFSFFFIFILQLSQIEQTKETLFSNKEHVTFFGNEVSRYKLGEYVPQIDSYRHYTILNNDVKSIKPYFLIIYVVFIFFDYEYLIIMTLSIFVLVILYKFINNNFSFNFKIKE